MAVPRVLSDHEAPCSSASGIQQLSKVKQKLSGCLRKRERAEAYCRIARYLALSGQP
ncbi:MAG: hypothetical protein L0H63_13155 [Nitrococcus sp.]|nr:hypothetical protein [Nitrococcus sp.]